MLRDNESHSVESSLSIAALATDHVCLMTLADPDTMTLKEALEQLDADEFLEAMAKEVDDHVRRDHSKTSVLAREE